MTKLDKLRKNVKEAKAELDEVMGGGYDDMVCRSFGMMLNDAENELTEHLEKLATSGGK